MADWTISIGPALFESFWLAPGAIDALAFLGTVDGVTAAAGWAGLAQTCVANTVS